MVPEKRTVENEKSEREPTAYLLFGLLSACIQHSIKEILRVTKPLNILDESKDTMHYRHGRT